MFRSHSDHPQGAHTFLIKVTDFKAYTDIYVNTQQLLFNTTLFYTWRHVSAAYTAIFRPAYNRTGSFMCAQYGIPHCLI